MKKESHHSTSHHSTDRTHKAHRVDTNSSHGDGNISDSSTTFLLGNRNARHNLSGKHKEEKYPPATGVGERYQDTGTSRKKEKERQTSNHPYSQIITTDQKAHEEKQKSSKRRNCPPDPFALVRYQRYQSDIKRKLGIASRALQMEERYLWRTSESDISYIRDIRDLEELAQEIKDIKKQGLTPGKAKKALDELLEIKGHLLE